MDLNFLRFRGQQIEEDIRVLVTNHDQILHTEFADKNTLYNYVLHKLSISGAIEAARKTFASTGNDNEILILNRMKVKDFIEDRDLISSFDKLELSSLFKYLPFLLDFGEIFLETLRFINSKWSKSALTTRSN